MSQQTKTQNGAALNAEEAAAARRLAALFHRPGLSTPMAETLARLAVTFLRDQPGFSAQAHRPEEAFVRTHCRPSPDGRVLGADLRRSFLVWKGGSIPDSAEAHPGRGRGDGVESALIRAALACFPDAKALATARVGGRRGRGVRGLELLPVTSDASGAAAPLAQERGALPSETSARVTTAAGLPAALPGASLAGALIASATMDASGSKVEGPKDESGIRPKGSQINEACGAPTHSLPACVS